MTYSKKIYKLRWKMLLTQQELASILGVSLPALSKWENNKSKPKDINKAKLDILFTKYNITDDKDSIFDQDSNQMSSEYQ